MTTLDTIQQYESSIRKTEHLISNIETFLEHFDVIKQRYDEMINLNDSIKETKLKIYDIIRKNSTQVCDSEECIRLQNYESLRKTLEEIVTIDITKYTLLLEEVNSVVSFREYYYELLRDYYEGKKLFENKMPNTKLKKLISKCKLKINKYKDEQFEFISKHVRSITNNPRKRTR